MKDKCPKCDLVLLDSIITQGPALQGRCEPSEWTSPKGDYCLGVNTVPCLRRQLTQRDKRIGELELSYEISERGRIAAHRSRESTERQLANMTERAEVAEVVVEKLRSAAAKMVLCFPDKIVEGENDFDIPAYVIDELREAARSAEETEEQGGVS